MHTELKDRDSGSRFLIRFVQTLEQKKNSTIQMIHKSNRFCHTFFLLLEYLLRYSYATFHPIAAMHSPGLVIQASETNYQRNNQGLNIGATWWQSRDQRDTSADSKATVVG